MIDVFIAEVRRSVTMFLRYPSEAITLVVSFTGMFLAIFYGAQIIIGPGFQIEGGRLETTIVKYLLWALTLYAMTGMAWTIQNEAQAGTLEQIFLSPFGPVKVFMLRAIADLLVQLAVILTVMVSILVGTHTRLHFSWTVILPILGIMFATYGLGYMFGGLTLLFKRIQNIIQLSQFGLLVLVMAPAETWTTGALAVAKYLLPISLLSGTLSDSMAHGTPLVMGDMLVGVVNSLTYFVLGIIFFRLAERLAKSRGLLGGY